MSTRFYFATCQTGAEKAVKAEVGAELPRLRFAFSRPGFITFKDESDEGPPLVLRNGIFTRLWGEALGQAKDPADLPALLGRVPRGALLHRFDRDLHIPGEEPEGFVRNGHIASAGRAGERAAIPAGIPEAGSRARDRAPRVGETVYDLIWIDDFHLFLGRHVHAEYMVDAPGNVPDIPLPAHSPSRAYLKIEEAFARFKPPLERGNTVLEVGCAPGGATTALLARGMRVTGVDPQYMAETVAAAPFFTHVRKPARFATPDDLRGCNPDWLVVDMSIAPAEALPELAHVLKVLRGLFGSSLRLRQGFITLKLNDWKLAAEIPSYLERLERMGFRSLHPIQLCANRQEFFVNAADFRR